MTKNIYTILKSRIFPYIKTYFTKRKKGEVALKSKALPYIILTGQVFLTIAAVTLLNPGCNAKVHIILAGFSFYVAGLMTLNFHLNQMESVCFGNRFIKVIRLMRHEFHNHLQVLFSMIQLKNTKKH